MRKNRSLKAAPLVLALAVLMTVMMAMPALAEHYNGGTDWNVNFTEGKEMVSNFSSSGLDDVLRGLQPGDDATFQVAIQNSNDVTTNWYMTNKILQSLEDKSYNSSTAGGAYTYRLTYTDTKGEVTVLFSSDEVGGENISPAGEGLNEATSALEDFFFLDELKKGDRGVVELTVGLDGETQNNDYQDTLAELQLNFAVEMQEGEVATTPTTSSAPTGGTSTRTSGGTATVVRTGDINNTMIYYIIMMVAGVVLLVAAILRIVAGRKKNQE